MDCRIFIKFFSFSAGGLIIVLTILSAWLIYPNNELRENNISGKTMGTTWSAKFITRNSQVGKDVILLDFERRLLEINQVMSTYIVTSEISLLNQKATAEWHEISQELFNIIQRSLKITELSEGAFDVTVGNAVNYYGFGSQKNRDKLPIGHKNIQLLPNKLYKAKPIKLDLSAIAKGYAVDELGKILKQYRIKDFLIEVGGEILVSGNNIKGAPWRIAIEKPNPSGREPLIILPLTNMGIASSGSYRNFVQTNDKLLSHTINPKTEQPIAHARVATTVLHQTTELADAWATAFMVLPLKRSLIIADNLGIALLIIEGNMFNQSELSYYASAKMKAMINKTNQPVKISIQ